MNILLENKTRDSYCEALREIQKISFEAGKSVDPEQITTDFELALQQAIKLIFCNCVLKGCWFHYSQALLRKVGQLGIKTKYKVDYKFRFWINQFISLALIPIETLENAFDKIIEGAKQFNSEPISNFLKYFIKQWLHGHQAPIIWNQHKTSHRTNNNLEGYHLTVTSSFLRYSSKSAQTGCIN